MIRKSLLILGALLLVVSGVAAVSAYESHLVNVTAKVENALSSPAAFSFGTIFPQEWVEKSLTVAASTSFKAQPLVAGTTNPRVNKIDFMVCAEPKPATAVTPTGGAYLWAGGFTYVSSTGAANSWQWISGTGGAVSLSNFTGPGAGVAVCPTTPVTGTADYTVDATIYVAMDAPVDTAFYNAQTDKCDKPRKLTNGFNPLSTTRTAGATGYVDGVSNGACQLPSVVADYVTGGDYFGLDLKIQVTNIR